MDLVKPGDSVSIYWETGKRKYWDAVVASTQEPPNASVVSCVVAGRS